MTQLSATVEKRIDAAGAADVAYQSAERRFYAATARLEQLDAELFNELDTAWVAILDAVQRVCWLDGWQCGRNPDLLVTAEGVQS